MISVSRCHSFLISKPVFGSRFTACALRLAVFAWSLMVATSGTATLALTALRCAPSAACARAVKNVGAAPGCAPLPAAAAAAFIASMLAPRLVDAGLPGAVRGHQWARNKRCHLQNGHAGASGVTTSGTSQLWPHPAGAAATEWIAATTHPVMQRPLILTCCHTRSCRSAGTTDSSDIVAKFAQNMFPRGFAFWLPASDSPHTPTPYTAAHSYAHIHTHTETEDTQWPHYSLHSSPITQRQVTR